MEVAVVHCLRWCQRDRILKVSKQTSAMILIDTTPVSSRNSLMAADLGSSPSSMPPYKSCKKLIPNKHKCSNVNCELPIAIAGVRY